MTEIEYDAYLNFVSGPLGTRLDDGESAALAISGRGSSIILDERKARRRASEGGATVSVASTLQLMLTSGYRQAWAVQSIRDLVISALKHSRMGVPKEDIALLKDLLGP